MEEDKKGLNRLVTDLFRHALRWAGLSDSEKKEVSEISMRDPKRDAPPALSNKD